MSKSHGRRMQSEERRRERQIEADDRHAEHSVRTPEEQLALIEKRRGNSKKERAKLLAKMEPDHFEGNIGANIAGGRV